MPRIHGIVERRRINFFDAFLLSELMSIDRGKPLRSAYEATPSGGQARALPAVITGRATLFGGRHTGDLRRTNLHLDGAYLAHETSTVIEHFYARTDFVRTDEALRLFRKVAQQIVATVWVGEKALRQFSLADLLEQGPWEPPSIMKRRMTEEEWAAMKERMDEGNQPLVIPVRQVFEISVESTVRVDELVHLLGGDTVTIWLHAEGSQVRDAC